MNAEKAHRSKLIAVNTGARRVRVAIVGFALVVPALSACGNGTVPAALPPTEGVFDYQLGGTYDLVTTEVGQVQPTVVTRDSTAGPLAGAYNICYVNGFQTQPEDANFWLSQSDLLLQDADGTALIDPEWPDEFVLDPTTEAQRGRILDRIGPIIDNCADNGFDAVEIDNLDTWARFDQIAKADAFALAGAYVERTHAAGLAIAQKNAAEAAEDAHDELGFDFAVAEECAAWDECGDYTDVYGAYVFQIEYRASLDQAGITFADACALTNQGSFTILRDVDLVAQGKPGYLYESC